MPLKDLPGYIQHIRKHGQTDAPVVEMGMIVDGGPRRSFGIVAFSAALCLFVGAGLFAYGSTQSIVIDAGGMESRAVADIVREEGGRVFSVRQNEDGTYEMKVFSFKKIGSLLEQLRGKNAFRKVESAGGG
jgi:hypothetical protein